MRQPECCYVDLALGAFSNRNNVVHVQEVRGHVQDMLKEGNGSSAYRTWCRYPQEYKDHVESTGSVRGYSGTMYADWLPFDFDDDEDVGRAHDQARAFVTELEMNWEVSPDNLLYWYSGRKGFHVAVPGSLFGWFDPAPDLHVRLGVLASKLAGEVKVDVSLYATQHLLRMENTRHERSGLYKVPLSPAEFLGGSMDEIKKLAEAPRAVVDLDVLRGVDVLKPNHYLVGLWQWSGFHIEQGITGGKKTASDVIRGNVPEGERDNTAFRLACQLRNRGLPPDEVLEILGWWDATNPVSLAETDGVGVLKAKVESAFQGREVPENRIRPEVVLGVEDRMEAYERYVKDLQARQAHLGIPRVDERIRGIAPGEVLMIVARPGVGKTALLQNILRHLSARQKTWSLFLSLEQPAVQVFEREAQMVGGMQGRDVERAWVNEDGAILREKVRKQVEVEMARSLVCELSAVRMDEMSSILEIAREKADGDMNVVAVDYLGYMDGHDLGRSAYERVSELAKGLKTFAKAEQVAVICISQVSRGAGGDGTTPLSMEAARESGVIEEASDFMLGAYRPGKNGENGEADDKICLQILKNRKGPEGATIECTFDRSTLRIEDPGVPV